MAEEVTAGYDGEPFCLGPNEQAMLPAFWSGQWVDKGKPPDQLVALQPPCLDVDSPVAKVMPGISSGEDSELMLCIYNDSPTSIHGEQGDVLAVARVLPAGFADHRSVRGSGNCCGSSDSGVESHLLPHQSPSAKNPSG